MGMHMNLQQIKNKIPLTKISWLGNLCAYIQIALSNIFNKMDISAFFKGIVAIAFIYLLLFLYVYSNGSETIKKIEDQITSENIPLTIAEKKDTPSNNSMEKGPKPISIVKGLHETTNIGRLPIIRKTDNLTSFRAYQRPFKFEEIKETDKPIISFIVVDYGLSKENSLSALDLLPAEVSFVLSPYSSLPKEWMAMAQNKGHEVWVNLPIQKSKSYDIGKYSIYHHSPVSHKVEAMYNILSKSQGYVGVSTFTDDGITSAKQHYIKMAEKIYHRGLGILELNPKAPKSIEGKAISIGAPYIKADLEVFKIKGEKNSFEHLEAIAKEKGHAVVVIPNYPSTLKNAAVWIMKVAKADYIIAPVSAIYDLPLYKSGHDTVKYKEIPTSPLNNDDHLEPEDNTHTQSSHH